MFRTSTYLEFRRRYTHDSPVYEWLQTAKAAIDSISRANEIMGRLLITLKNTSDRLEIIIPAEADTVFLGYNVAAVSRWARSSRGIASDTVFLKYNGLR